MNKIEFIKNYISQGCLTQWVGYLTSAQLIRALCRALCWELRAWILLQILCLPLSLSLTHSHSVSVSLKNKQTLKKNLKKKKKKETQNKGRTIIPKEPSQLSPSYWQAKGAWPLAIRSWMEMPVEMWPHNFLCYKLSVDTYLYVCIHTILPHIHTCTHVYTHVHVYTHTDLGVKGSLGEEQFPFPRIQSLSLWVRHWGWDKDGPDSTHWCRHDFGSFIWALECMYYIPTEPQFNLLLRKINVYQRTLCYTMMHEVSCTVLFCIARRIQAKLSSLG